MQITFEIDTDNLVVADMLLIEDIQDGKRQYHNMVDLLSKHMVDSSGERIEPDEAKQVLAQLKMSQYAETARLFVEELKRKAVPPGRGGS